jgi:hypothetical protein
LAADRWLSAYLVREEPLHELLRDAVRPFVARAEADGLIDRFFFIRYRERGSHVRLRLRATSPALRDSLERHFGDYMATHPSPPRVLQFDDPLPLDSVQYVAYERQFEASSRAVLALPGDDWTYDRALSAAMWMHLTFAIAAPMSRAEAAAFFEAAVGALAHWHHVDRRELLAAFDERFDEQLAASVANLWELLQGDIDVDWLRDWREAMRPILAAVRARAAEPLPILFSYMHMTNNRLGVANRDEAWLAYLLSRSLR